MIVRRDDQETQGNLILPAKITKDDGEKRTKPFGLEESVNNRKLDVCFYDQLNEFVHRIEGYHTQILRVIKLG